MSLLLFGQNNGGTTQYRIDLLSRATDGDFCAEYNPMNHNHCHDLITVEAANIMDKRKARAYYYAFPTTDSLLHIFTDLESVVVYACNS